jgi:flagellar biosynthesis GTPase FlhF
MKTALEKVCESDEASSDVEEWMHQLREVSYDVKDCIEIFVHRINHGDSSGGFIQHTIRKLSTLKARYRIGNKIKELMARVEEVSHRHNRYKDISSTSRLEHVEMDPRLCAVFEEANRLVGIDSQRDTVAASLTDGIGLHPQRMVVSIVGPGGLGKTTLAHQVFEKIKSQFDCNAFVTV